MVRLVGVFPAGRSDGRGDAATGDDSRSRQTVARTRIGVPTIPAIACAGTRVRPVGVDPTDGTFNCASCDAEFESPAGISQHVSIDHLECVSCRDVFDNEEELNEHTVENH